VLANLKVPFRAQVSTGRWGGGATEGKKVLPDGTRIGKIKYQDLYVKGETIEGQGVKKINCFFDFFRNMYTKGIRGGGRVGNIRSIRALGVFSGKFSAWYGRGHTEKREASKRTSTI